MHVQRVRNYVQHFYPSLEPIVMKEEMHTAETAARVLQVEIGQIAKSLLFKCGSCLGLFVAAGDKRLDSKRIKECLKGSGKTKMAAPEEVETITGYLPGAVCPFALKQSVPIFLDESLSRFQLIYTAAGIAESLLPLSFDQLKTITSGTVAAFTK